MFGSPCRCCLGVVFSLSHCSALVPQVRLNSDQERFLIVPFGLLYSEVSASSLVRAIFLIYFF